MEYGYARVSTLYQREDRQLDDFVLCGLPINRIYVDKQSGKDFKRPQYLRMYKRLKNNDVVIIKSIVVS